MMLYLLKFWLFLFKISSLLATTTLCFLRLSMDSIAYSLSNSITSSYAFDGTQALGRGCCHDLTIQGAVPISRAQLLSRARQKCQPLIEDSLSSANLDKSPNTARRAWRHAPGLLVPLLWPAIRWRAPKDGLRSKGQKDDSLGDPRSVQ
jgi:hypothetical protein